MDFKDSGSSGNNKAQGVGGKLSALRRRKAAGETMDAVAFSAPDVQPQYKSEPVYPGAPSVTDYGDISDGSYEEAEESPASYDLPTEAPDEVKEFDFSEWEENISEPVSATEPQPQTELEPEAEEEAEEVIDYVYGEDEYDCPARPDSFSFESIADEYVSSEGIKLEEIRTEKNEAASSIKAQMQADDLEMSVGSRPKLDNISDGFESLPKKNSELAAKGTLDRDEKQLIKTRLKEEMSAKPDNYDKKKSMAMYKKLMEEQKAKAAKQGLFMLFITALTGVLTAAYIYFIKPNEGGQNPVLDYLPLGALVFSVVMMLKSKFFKVLSALYFLGAAALLTYPGLVTLLQDCADMEFGQEFIVKVGLYVVAILLCAAVFVRLVTLKDIEDYYSYKRVREKKKKR